MSLMSPTVASGFFTTSTTWEVERNPISSSLCHFRSNLTQEATQCVAEA